LFHGKCIYTYHFDSDPGVWHGVRTVTKQEDPQTSNTTSCTSSLQEKSVTDDVAMITCEKSSDVSVDGTTQTIQIPESDSFDCHDVTMTTSENTGSSCLVTVLTPCHTPGSESK
jgi:hypothetical protein